MNRFIAAAVRGMTMLRNAMISKRHPKVRMMPRKSGSLRVRTVAKSSLVAVTPPT